MPRLRGLFFAAVCAAFPGRRSSPFFIRAGRVLVDQAVLFCTEKGLKGAAARGTIDGVSLGPSGIFAF